MTNIDNIKRSRVLVCEQKPKALLQKPELCGIHNEYISFEVVQADRQPYALERIPSWARFIYTSREAFIKAKAVYGCKVLSFPHHITLHPQEPGLIEFEDFFRFKFTHNFQFPLWRIGMTSNCRIHWRDIDLDGYVVDELELLYGQTQ